jgi:cysteinyl-tRNA synthetase
MVEGQKMSKSKGNFFTARDLFAKGIEPAALRLELIRTHYRSNANFTMQGLADCQRMIDRWRRWLDSASTPGPASAAASESQTRFAAAMHDDLNIALALAELNGITSNIASPTTGDADAFRACESILAVLSLPRPAAQTTTIAVYAPGVTPSDEIEALLTQRRDARAAKDFKKSDEIRDALAAKGLAIKDTAGGKVEVSRKA